MRSAWAFKLIIPLQGHTEQHRIITDRGGAAAIHVAPIKLANSLMA